MQAVDGFDDMTGALMKDDGDVTCMRPRVVVWVILSCLLAGCVSGGSGGRGMMAGGCLHGVCAPSHDAQGGWQPVFGLEDGSRFLRGGLELRVHDGSVVWMGGAGEPALRAYDVDRGRVQEVAMPSEADSDAEIVGQAGKHILVGVPSWRHGGQRVDAVAPDATAHLARDGIRVLDVDGVRVLLSWVEDGDEVLAAWVPSHGSVHEWARRSATQTGWGASFDGDGVLLVEHKVQPDGSTFERSIRRIGPTAWDARLDAGMGITAVSSTPSGYVTHGSTHAHHRHHHSSAQWETEILFFGPDARTRGSVVDTLPTGLARSTGSGIVAGWDGLRFLADDRVHPPFAAHGYDTARDEAYRFHDGHVWRAPAGTPLPDDWRS